MIVVTMMISTNTMNIIPIQLFFLTFVLKAFDVPVVLSETGAEFINDGSWDTIFVLEEFSGPVYDAIHHSEQRFVYCKLKVNAFYSINSYH
jgi:hypothetical protein